MRAVASRLTLLTLLAACGDPAARVQLVPVDLGDCGKPSRAAVATMVVTAYTPTGEVPKGIPLDATGAIEISDFPAGTMQLGVELHGPAGVIAAGKTAPLAFSSLADRAQIPIAILPLGGFCAVGPLVQARTAPLVARAGDGVLIAGGTGTTGDQLPSAEYYDPATASFAPVALPSDLIDNLGNNGLAGGVLTTLPDGTAALAGTAAHALAIFDPKTLAFDTPKLLDARTFQGALAPAADRLFVIGGCADVSAGACSGGPVDSSFTFHLPDPTIREDGPALPGGASRVAATVFDVGIASDGVHRYELAGGTGDAGAADRFALADAATTTLGGLEAQVVELDGGVLVSAFAPDGMPASGAASQLAPEGDASVPIATASPNTGARLVALEDGSALAIGSDVTRYVPTVNAWTPLVPPSGPPANGVAPGALVKPALVRLADGSVLVIAGAGAWLYRASLVGASSGLVEVMPDGSTPGVLVPLDAATATHPADQLVLSGPALVGGFRATEAQINALVQITGDHVQLIAQSLGPGRALIGDLQSGTPARVLRLDGGTSHVLCSGSVAPALDGTSAAIGLQVVGHSAVLSLATTPLATCDLTDDADAGDVGAWGISALDGAQVQITTLTVKR
jgi:hypothetical protein